MFLFTSVSDVMFIFN